MHVQVEDRQSASTAQTTTIRRWLVAAAVLLVAIVILAIVFYLKWPFTRNAIVQDLQQEAGSQVNVGSFRETFFPHPGAIAKQVTFSRDGHAVITIESLTLVGSYPGLLTHHLSTVRADGMNVLVAPQGAAGSANSGPLKLGSLTSGCTIGNLIADGAEVDVQRGAGEQPFAFHIQKLTLRDLKDNQPLSFQASVQLPIPPAQVDVAGKFGPWQSGKEGQTALSGTYSVPRMNLGAFSGIDGTLTSSGNFNGVLQHIQVQGTTDTPQFMLTQAKHAVDLATAFHAIVNGLNGDVALQSVAAHFGKTTVAATGSIEGQSQDPGAGKTVSLDIYSGQARIQDLLWLFVSDNPPAMAGSIKFRAKVTLPPENRPFLERVQLQGDFGISAADYPHQDTQKDIDVLSARARGKAGKVERIDDKIGNDSFDPGHVLSNVQGHVTLRNAVARLTNIYFEVPGASARVSGTYNLNSEKVDLQGKMHLDTQLSKATTGIKSFLLKVAQPFIKSKKSKGSLVDLKIGGTYENPSYSVMPVAKQ